MEISSPDRWHNQIKCISIRLWSFYILLCKRNMFLGTDLHVLKISLFVALMITRNHYGKCQVMHKQHMGAVNDFRGTEVKSGYDLFLTKYIIRWKICLEKGRNVGEDGASIEKQCKMHGRWRERLASSNPSKSKIEAKIPFQENCMSV